MKLFAVLLTLAAPAQAEGALDWLVARTEPGLVGEAGRWAATSGTIFAVDPLTLHGRQTPLSGLLTHEAEVLGFYPPSDRGRTGLMALIWSEAPVVCGEDVSTIGVDTGLAAFLSPIDLMALDEYASRHGDNLHDSPYADQIDRFYPGPTLIDLPHATRVPLTGSGWGGGGYPVATLKDASGAVTALYTQFITAEGEDWLLPPPCGAASS